MKLQGQPGAPHPRPPSPRPSPPASPQPPAPDSIAHDLGGILFAAATGLWLGLALLKFGNPAVLEHRIAPPTDLLEFILSPWPPVWGEALLAVLLLAGIRLWRWQANRPAWLMALPLAWFIWQVLASLQTLDPSLTRPVIAHFATAVGAFYLGLFALSTVTRLRLFWFGLCGGFLLVLAVGWQQHLGGLEETRRYFYSLPNWQEFPPEFIRKVGSDRIYGTLFYPNTLAGVILLLLPATLAAASRAAEAPAARWLLTGTVGVAALATLHWSGSKAGWLILLGLALLALLHLNFARKIKVTILLLIAVGGLAGFFVAHAAYFSRGATSVAARLDYWKAGWQLMAERPIFGFGPGTFQIGYARLKPADAEMARLTHNDYLQQGADSGVPGLLLYSALMLGLLARLYRGSRPDSMRFAVWLGLLGLATQSLVEFGLYIPATAWPQFLLLGWLWGTESQPES